MRLAMPPSRMLRRFAHGHAAVPGRELGRYFFDMEMLMHAGIPLLDGLADMAETSEPALRRVVRHMMRDIQSGSSLSQAMQRHHRVFDAVCVALVRAGEQSGHLEQVFGRLGLMLKWRADLASQGRTALIYPALLMLVLCGVTLFLLVYLVPQLAGFMRTTGQALPLSTRLLLALSDLLRLVWPVLPLLPFSLWLGWKWLPRWRPRWRARIDGVRLRLWMIGPLLKQLILARLLGTFAMLYASGVGIIESLGFLRGVAGNQVVERTLQGVILAVESGAGLESSLRRTGLFSPPVLRMVRLGEQTGSLEQALTVAADWLERDARQTIARMQALAIFMGLMLGWVIVSVLLPLYDVISKVPL